ncbi:MAG: anion transporter [Acidobacteriia bacterium]|nr:anion transporter [Terriglobia bacterium]
MSPAAVNDARVAAGYAIFLASYLVFAIGKFPGTKIDRAGAAIVGAVLMVALGVVTPHDALTAVDFSTIVLLFSMMVIVAYLHQAGFFDWITELVVTRLKPHHLLPTVIFTSGVLSAFFVNDIICLVMVPFVLDATRRMGVKPLPYLLAVATASNIGSVATITGNPQNMLIGSFSGIAYRDFLLHLGPIALVGLLLDWLLIHLLCARVGTRDPVTDLPDPVEAVDRSRLVKPGIVILMVITGFLAGLPPALVAAFGAAMMLITRTREPRLVYDEVDWGLLVFFVGLFVIVGGAEKAGVTERLLAFANSWNLHHPAAFTVVVAALSNVVSNVPAVMLLKSLVPGFANPHGGWLVLAMASTLAGNLTITGSVANIIVVERSKHVAPISFREYFAVGLPITVATLLFGFVWLWLTS